MIRRFLAALAFVAAPLCPAPAQAQSTPDLYARVDQLLGANPALAESLGSPAPQMASVQWMVGSWEVEALVIAGAGGASPERGQSVVTPLFGGVWLEIRDTYPSGVQDVGYLGFNVATGRWNSMAIDSLGNVNLVTSSGWDGDRMTFEGDFLILGLSAHLRQILTRESPDAYRVENQELVAGEWRTLDGYHYTRMPAG